MEVAVLGGGHGHRVDSETGEETWGGGDGRIRPREGRRGRVAPPRTAGIRRGGAADRK